MKPAMSKQTTSAILDGMDAISSAYHLVELIMMTVHTSTPASNALAAGCHEVQRHLERGLEILGAAKGLVAGNEVG